MTVGKTRFAPKSRQAVIRYLLKPKLVAQFFGIFPENEERPVQLFRPQLTATKQEQLRQLLYKGLFLPEKRSYKSLMGGISTTWADQKLKALVLCAAVAITSATRADDPIPTANGTDALIKSLVVASLPREFENTKHWGKTKPRWDGLHVSLDGLQIKTKRRWKDVNHGHWTRYKATLIDPERELVIRSDHLRQTTEHRIAFDLAVDAKLALAGRMSEWQLGIQLYSFSAEADATVRLRMACEVGLTFDTAKFPPDVAISPRVTNAQLELLQFQLHSISDADGPLVHKLGERLRDVLQEELDDQRPKLVEKINRAINKNSGKLKLSLHDLTASGWSKLAPMPEAKLSVP